MNNDFYLRDGKRALDVAGAGIALLLFSPLLIIIALAIYAGDGASPFFLHTRVGLGGKRFSLIKFRTMQPNNGFAGDVSGDMDPAQLTALRDQFTGTRQNDPRITPVGRWLRKTHFDELPQLWNVVTGDMSLIGPRPDTPVQMSDYSPSTWELRNTVRPGITGLAQIHPERVQSEADRQEFDITYIRNISLMLDIHITLKTVAKMFKANSF